MNKTIQYILVGAVSLSALSLTSCNKFLDVQPKGTLTEDVQFSTYEGYIDALYGVYGTMATSSLYGSAMTYGYMDKLGQLFRKTNTGTEGEDPQFSSFNYSFPSIRQSGDNLWASLYKTISYANNILRHVAEPQFSDPRLQRIQAEAYGLRAFLHLDVYRLFGPMDYAAHKSERLLPYSTTFNLENKDVYMHEQFLGLILQDLQQAEALMGEDETIRQDDVTDTEITKNRVVHFNKYALYALYARVYSLMGNSEKANEYASKVIAKFSLVESTKFASVRRFPAPGEMIFGLYAPKFLGDAQAYFAVSELYGRADLEGKIYEATTATAGNRDERYPAFYSNQALFGQGEKNKLIRFGATATEIDRVPTSQRGITILRLPEMYYIQAEARFRLGQTAEALESLNAVRRSRGLQGLEASSISSLSDLKQQLLLEYIKEYPGEGQVFFAMKRLQVPFTNYEGGTMQPSETIFVLPRPEAEQNYGKQ